MVAKLNVDIEEEMISFLSAFSVTRRMLPREKKVKYGLKSVMEK